jgi:ribA/ribD-fused uncharacterized protein
MIAGSVVQNVVSFDGDERFLSNFYPSPVELGGVTYPTVENAYQAAKTASQNRGPFVSCSPGEAKKLGRTVELVSNWDEIKERVMEKLLYRKFYDNPELGRKLDATGDMYLMEGNTWGDTYWGMCDGVGKNRLGALLMYVRGQLRQL